MDMKTIMAETYNADLSSSKQVCLILIKQSYQKFEFTKLYYVIQVQFNLNESILMFNIRS